VGVILIGLFILSAIAALIETWFSAGGDLGAEVDLGGRWGRGTLGSAVLALGFVVVFSIVVEAFAIRALRRGWSSARPRRR